MKKVMFAFFVPLLLVIFPLSLFMDDSADITFSFKESELREYMPIASNNITCDELYGRIVESKTEKCYEFLLYWEYQEGTYKFAEHENDWEFIVVYTYPNGSIEQVNFDSWHYYIGRKINPDAYNDTNVLMHVDPDFHYFRPDRVIRSGNVTWQLEKQKIHELTDEVLYTAKSQVGFDIEIYENPFSWKEMGFLGRYTAFDSNWKAFWVVADKKFEFVDFEDEDNLLTRWM